MLMFTSFLLFHSAYPTGCDVATSRSAIIDCRFMR
jgi:hypothetical protein